MQSSREARSPKYSSEDHRIAILRKAFEVYDVDGSGAIDYNEFKRLLEDLGWPSHEEFLHRAVRVLDQDMSGEIEFSEFQKWTEFAYASRILYRQEMYGSGPRYASNDGVGLQPIAKEPTSSNRGLVIRRASLTTVFEGQEANEQKILQSAYEHGESSDEDVDDIAGGSSLALQSSPSSCARDAKQQDQNSDGRAFRSHGKEGSPFTRAGLDGKICFQPTSQEQNDPESSDHHKAGGKKEEKRGADENEVADLKFSTPVKEMATMVLTPSRRGSRIHTSRSRSKSAGMLSDRRGDRLNGSVPGGKKAFQLYPRTESKMTVRMRWACGQFRNAVVGDDKQSGSNSQSTEGGSSEGGDEAHYEELSKMCRQSQRTSGDDADRVADSSVYRPRSNVAESAEKVSTSASCDVWQDVGVDLRRIRSD